MAVAWRDPDAGYSDLAPTELQYRRYTFAGADVITLMVMLSPDRSFIPETSAPAVEP
jgi:hypothetical protein